MGSAHGGHTICVAGEAVQYLICKPKVCRSRLSAVTIKMNLFIGDQYYIEETPPRQCFPQEISSVISKARCQG